MEYNQAVSAAKQKKIDLFTLKLGPIWLNLILYYLCKSKKKVQKVIKYEEIARKIVKTLIQLVL